MAEKKANAQSNEVRAKFEATGRELGSALVERDTEIELVLTAMVADEHVLLISLPGEAKSMLLDALIEWMHCKKFSVLLNGQSTLGDVYGPVSMSAMKQDKHLRATAGKLPEAHAAFIDEIFKGNSSVRNCLLRAINERQYEVGDGSFGKIPLRICLAASNEYPRIEDEADAIFDRFIFRKTVKQVTSSSGLSALIFGGDHKPNLSTSLTLDELDQARADARKIEWSNEAKEAMLLIVHELNAAGIYPSGRRLVKSYRVCQASAWLEGAAEVDTEHLAILAHVLWVNPQEQPAKCASIVLKHANPSAARVNQRLEEAEQIVNGVKGGDMAATQTAVSKLNEIVKKLRTEKSAKAKMAVQRIEGEIKRVKADAIAKAQGV